MSKTLVELNIITVTGKKGKRPLISLSQLQPLFKVNGYPKGITLTLPGME